MLSAHNLYHSKIFLHFVKITVFPAILVGTAKIAFMLFFSMIYNLQYSLTAEGIVFNNTDSFILANDYSNILTFLLVFSFTLWLIFKGFYLHHSHISPSLSAWLHNQSLEKMIVKSFELYVKTAVWVIFLWLICVLVLIHYLLGLTSNWVLILSLLLTSFSTVLAVIDIEKEHLLYITNN